MLALIFPDQNNKIVQVNETSFPVALPLHWVNCPDDCTPEWIYVDNTFLPPPAPTAEDNKITAISLLQSTDWTQIPSVSDPLLSDPYLSNKAEFDIYRNNVRQYAIYPQEGNINWPTLPQEIWTTSPKE
jgi:hypothetical protein